MYFNRIGTLIQVLWSFLLKFSIFVVMANIIKNKAAYSDEVTPLESQNSKVSYNAALEGIVLLKNDGCLPLKSKKIALYGAGAIATVKGGSGSGEVNERHSINIKEGLEAAGFEITTKDWLDSYAYFHKKGINAYKKQFVNKLLKFDFVNLMSDPYRLPTGREITQEDIEKSAADTCIYVVARQAGEGGDRKLDKKDYSITNIEKENIALCARMYKNTIVIINTGSTFDLNFEEEIEGINAVVYFCQQGCQGGAALASILKGDVSPSGKTVDTWARQYTQFPYSLDYSYLGHDLKKSYYKEGIFVGYRYFDSFGVNPKYEFGYGLSYTEFEITKENTLLNGSEVNVCARVKNIGNTYSGKEVVQLYVSAPKGDMGKEYQSLMAFAKTPVLQPGEHCEVKLTFDIKCCASYSETLKGYELSGGDYILRLGNSSRNTQIISVISLDKDTVVRKTESVTHRDKNLYELRRDRDNPVEDTSSVAHFSICGETIEQELCSYYPPNIYSDPEVDEVSKRLNIYEKMQLIVGNGFFGGKKYFEAPGAVGNTTGNLMYKGIPNINMADGPAGLRLQKRTAETKRGKLKMIDPMMDFLKYLPIPPFIKPFIFGSEKRDKVLYQFVTSFPVGTALAQSWNVELVRQVGEAVSSEMTRYGINFWLAPALNIHRNPLCGRNFEYYSEDPVLSGKMAAAMTLGVQSTPGNFVVIKHFCCNNQEDNRQHNDSVLSERALREIYLKGFEIAIREGNPEAVMSSYNLVNGEYVCNSHDLLTKVLRNEWNFEGLVMTDWFATGKKKADNRRCAVAGNDLIMPGTRRAYKDILKAYKRKEIPESAIKRSSANVLRSIVKTDLYKDFPKGVYLPFIHIKIDKGTTK